MRIHFLSFIVVLLSSPVICHAQSFSITNNPGNQTVTISNSNLTIVVDYNHGCRVSAMEVNGINVIAGNTGIYSAIQTKDKTFSTLQLKNSPKVKSSKNSVEINDIVYGDANLSIHENWKFIASDSNIQFSITRSFPKSFEAQSVSFPAMEFNNINTWEGAFQGFGGIAWFYLFNEKLMTYGVHTNEVSFWNSANDNGLHVLVNAPGKQVAMKYSRTDDDKLNYSIAVSQKEMLPRYDSGTHRRR